MIRVQCVKPSHGIPASRFAAGSRGPTADRASGCRDQSQQQGGIAMKAGIIYTGTGPILILTSYKSFRDPKLIEKLGVKGIEKFIACEISLENVQQKYGAHFADIQADLGPTDDLRVLDYNGHQVFRKFSFDEMGDPIYYP
jgi:hypothetical protein